MKKQIDFGIPVPAKLHSDVAKNLYWIDKGIRNIIFEENGITLEFEGDELPPQVEESVKTNAVRLIRNFEKIKPRLFFEAPADKTTYTKDPYQGLVEKGWLKMGAHGTHVYTGQALQLLKALDELFLRTALDLGAAPYKFPTLISTSTLYKAGYLDSYPHNANFVFHLQEGLDVKEKFGGVFDKDKLQLKQGAGWSPSGTMLSPTVCHHFYQYLEGRTLEQDMVLSTATSSCYRYESKATGSLRRLREFNMREIIAAGKKEEVMAFKMKLLEALKAFIMESGLQINIVGASDAFFVSDYDKQRMYQLTFDLKQEGEAYLPFDGSWFSVVSVNYHQDHFGKAFHISAPGGEVAHSCCIGYGLDRLLYAIFAQFGLVTADWPGSLKKTLQV